MAKTSTFVPFGGVAKLLGWQVHLLYLPALVVPAVRSGGSNGEWVFKRSRRSCDSCVASGLPAPAKAAPADLHSQEAAVSTAKRLYLVFQKKLDDANRICLLADGYVSR